MKIKKCVRAALLLVLAQIVFVSCAKEQETVLSGSGDAATAGQDGEAQPPPEGYGNNNKKENWDINKLISVDFLLYNVDCGAVMTESFPEGETCGLSQSVSDREYGIDEATGQTWGYRRADYLVREEDSLGEGFTAAKWGIGRETEIAADQAEICYDFELPKGNYLVTVGFYNPFGVRTVDVDCEGLQVVEDKKILRYQIAEEEFEAEISDGILNLCVYNGQGKNFMDTPILSYIRIRATPEYNRELLLAALEGLVPEEGADRYTGKSYSKYIESFMEAKQLAEQDEVEPEVYKEYFTKLKGAFDMLVKKYRYDSFQPGEQWRDTEGNIIQAHGGQVQKLALETESGEIEEKWVWIGEDKTFGYRGGVCAYSSDDLYNWQFEGIIMKNVPSRETLDTDSYFRELYAGYTDEQLDNVFMSLNAERAVIERPKLIYNETTKQYVLWFHADGPTAQSDSNYAAACAGVAVSDSPFGPYRFIDRYRLNVCPEDQEDKHPQSRGMARDMNLFRDVDGTAYIIYSSEENLTLYISKLNESFTYLAADPDKAVYGKDFIRLFPGAQREAPAMFFKDGKYYLMTSGCTGWAPNQAGCYVADEVMGEWQSIGDPCIGDSDHTTFHSQSTCIFWEPETDTWIYMGDRWNEEDLGDSRYLWLPVSFDDNGKMHISFVQEWELEGGGGK